MKREEAKRIAMGLRIDFKCESDTMVDFCNTIIKVLEQEPCEDWYDVPSDEMTLEQARQAVKDLRKMWAERLEQEPCEDCISKANALCVAKNEYLRGWHNALCKALSEKYSIHCEEGNFNVIQEETITGLGLSMDCAVGKDVESYMSALPSVQPKAKVCKWIKYDYRTVCPREHDVDNPYWRIPENRMNTLKYCPYCGGKIEVEE